MKTIICPAAVILRCTALLALTLLTACRTPRNSANPISIVDGRAHLKPVVAVTDFENRAGMQGQWNLGAGMAELLTSALLETDRLVLLERKNINEVVGEIARQGQPMFRPEGRVERGRLMNAQYLIRGTITDFTVVSDSSGGLSYLNIFSLFGSSSKARVALAVQVVDVASGRILYSVKTDGTASAGGAGGRIDYKQVSFGGDSFFRTPLGEATSEAIENAVEEILEGMKGIPWKPVVADVDGTDLIVNGGANVGLKPATIYLVRETPRDITDPVTGNTIESVPGRVIGRIQLTEIRPTSAGAKLREGTARRGDLLEPVSTDR